MQQLEEKLLAIGGERVIRQPGHQPYLDILLARGRVFEAKGRKKIKGELHCCHHNSALHYLWHHLVDSPCNIVTGYGLSRGAWWQHNWLFDGRRVLETTILHQLYFGVVLDEAEAFDFIMRAVMDIAPGAKAFFDSLPARAASLGDGNRVI
jgi:hypothetical protein